MTKYKGIVVVSGDGLVHEIINGLMERNDWSTAIQTPISQIGAGSGNAFSTSISFLSNETYQDVSLEKLATSMAFLMLKSKPEPLDLIKVQLANKQIIHSFLNIEWCIVADVDLESENYRYFGGLRFFIGMIKRIISKLFKHIRCLKDPLNKLSPINFEFHLFYIKLRFVIKHFLLLGPSLNRSKSESNYFKFLFSELRSLKIVRSVLNSN